MYLGSGIEWANQMLPQPEPKTHCDCGKPVAPNDFLCEGCRQTIDQKDNELWDEDDESCHYCDGDGWGIIGVNWDCDDPINGPYDGEIEKCPCCGGSGKEKDATFW